MTIEQIQLGLALLEHKNFSKAAEACYISQSSFSKKIKALEEELDVILFERRQKSIEPTSAGLDFEVYAKKIIEAYRDMKFSMVRHKETEDRLSVGVMGGAPEYQIMPMLADYDRMGSTIELVIREVEAVHLIPQMDDLQFDAVIAWRELIPIHWYALPILEDTMLFITAEGHPLVQKAKEGSIALEEAAGEPFILPNQSAFRQMDIATCQLAGFEPRAAHYSSHPFSLLKMVAEGLGVGLIYKAAYDYYQFPGVVAFLPQQEYKTQLVAGFVHPESDASQTLIRYLQMMRHENYISTYKKDSGY
ncbi:LysR family transcriptional regulator [Ruminococcaceae bacterium OttesenSCG-928-I18]|nr:LysR family transcriptional regulator [Ruminococcaceae bacterium OttesenSCG-928-I18]